MLKLVKRFLTLAGNLAWKLKIAIFFSFIESILINIPIITVYFLLFKLISKTATIRDSWFFGAVILGSLVLRYATHFLVLVYQTGTGYEIFERERIKIGERFKRFPMGFFNEGNMGNITTVITSDLVFIEEMGMSILDKVVTNYIGIFIGVVFLIYIDYRVALITIGTYLLSLLFLKKLQSVGKELSFVRQDQQSKLSTAVLEYVQGISVIKAFNLSGEKAKTVSNAFESTRDHAIEFEKTFVPLETMYETCFAIGTSATVLAVSMFYIQGTVSLSMLLMLLIFIFQLYLPSTALGSITSQVRVAEAGLDRYEKIMGVDIIDKDGREISLTKYDIKFNNVSFAYEEKDVLKNISFTIPEHSMTALVGVSGCGKTTIANLIARFWDVQKGEILVGGVNVKNMTCDSLLINMSMVFQNVYLFNDTIFNNIKFGNPGASYEEVLEAAEKARCHDFISNMENGYEAMVGEGGSTLSGGEKQRISIARAILKDAPIILLDEATASVDPENEYFIQMAINELVKNKTLVVIAHRLSTIRNADQILVLEDGKLVQTGIHDDLLKEQGVYSNFWKKRTTARGWKIT